MTTATRWRDLPWSERDPNWVGVREETVHLGGVPVRVLRHDASPDAPADATPHLLVHGLGGSSITWIDAMVDLAAQGPVAALDLPGFGRSPLAAGVDADPATYADVVHRVRRELGWDRVVLHGNSLGGLVAVLAERADPEAVEALALVAPALPPDLRRPFPLHVAPFLGILPMAVPGAASAMLARARDRGQPFAADAVTRAVFHDWESVPATTLRAMGAEAAELRRPWRQKAIVDATRRVITRILLSRGTRDAVRDVAAPTLVVWGQSDRLLPPTILRGIESRRPDWDVVRMERAGHSPQMERPGDYARLVDDWRAGRPVPERRS